MLSQSAQINQHRGRYGRRSANGLYVATCIYPTMRDLTDARGIAFKALLFLLLGLFCGALLLARGPGLFNGILLLLTVWCFCRLYYFAFYEIERYIDRDFRYSGLLSVFRSWLRR